MSGIEQPKEEDLGRVIINDKDKESGLDYTKNFVHRESFGYCLKFRMSALNASSKIRSHTCSKGIFTYRLAA